MLNANCPNCGAPVGFRWSGAVQTTCTFCHSILVRRDVNLQKVGQVADLPPDPSPIQIGAEGIYRNRRFTAIGRIIYEYEQGGWNEWHILFDDGASGWLSDAQAQYAVSFLSRPSSPLPAADHIRLGRKFDWPGGPYRVTAITRARYRGVEGELPFEYWDHSEVPFVDLRTQEAHFGTIDYSESPPLLFLGEAVEFDELKLRNLRQFEGWQ